MQLILPLTGLYNFQLELHGAVGDCSIDYCAMFDYILSTYKTYDDKTIGFCVTELINSRVEFLVDASEIYQLIEKAYALISCAFAPMEQAGYLAKKIISIDMSLETITLELYS